MRLTHLHAHTTFSFLDGYGTPEQLARRLQELGHNAAAITDHGNIIGHVPCAQAYEKVGVKPIFGCEFYICDDIKVRDKNHALSTNSDGLPHITVLAKTQEGYSNLLKLSRLSYESGFYFRPRIDHEVLSQHSKGLIVLSGCPTGYPTRILRSIGYEEMIKHLIKMKSMFEDFYVEIVPQPNWEVSHEAAPALWNASIQLGIPVVFTADSHFPRPADYPAQDALLAVGLRKTVFDEDREIKLPAYQYYCSAEELLERARLVLPLLSIDQLRIAVNNSSLIGDMCQVELKKAQPVTFPDLPANMTSDDLLWQWCGQGFKLRELQGLITPEVRQRYYERLVYEFKALRVKKFSDYILAIADVIKWMKNHNHLVMTRGSAGGSLMLWLLGASETDPIKHGLSFERFYDDTRNDPPDVDIDFEQQSRDEAIDYIYAKYGRDKCSQIAALSRLGPKGAVQDAASALGIHRSEFSALSDVLNDKDMDMERQLATVIDAKAKAVMQKYPALAPLIKGIVGQYRHSSVHAAGVLVSSAPLEEVIGVIISDNKPIAAVDKYGAAYLGFLKIDMLSVQALDVIGMAARNINKDDVSWLYNLPLNDNNVLKTARDGRLAGIFQLDGSSANRALKEIGADSFNDLVAASVLCRPGAIEFISIYRDNKHNANTFTDYLSKMHPKVAEIVKDTYGILMYQEQVMRIAREVAGLSWPEVHRLRKDVVNKVGLDPQKGDAWRAEWLTKFVDGCVAHVNMSGVEAMKWWEAVQHHGGYSFNKSHAVTYGIVGYWMLFLKTYYPAQFYEAYLKLENDDIVKKRLIMEFKKGGGTVKLLDYEHSGIDFKSIDNTTLVGGFSDLKYTGAALAKRTADKGPFTSWDTMLTAIPKRSRELVLKSGLGSDDVDPSYLIKVAPWMPVPCIKTEDAEIKVKYNLRGPSEMPSTSIDGQMLMCGYVTLTDFEKDRIIFIMEDAKDFAMVRIASKRVRNIGPKFRQIEEGDFIAVQGWWTGDTMFASDYTLLRRIS